MSNKKLRYLGKGAFPPGTEERDIYFNTENERYYWGDLTPIKEINAALDEVEGPDGFKSGSFWGRPFTSAERKARGLD